MTPLECNPDLLDRPPPRLHPHFGLPLVGALVALVLAIVVLHMFWCPQHQPIRLPPVEHSAMGAKPMRRTGKRGHGRRHRRSGRSTRQSQGQVVRVEVAVNDRGWRRMYQPDAELRLRREVSRLQLELVDMKRLAEEREAARAAWMGRAKAAEQGRAAWLILAKGAEHGRDQATARAADLAGRLEALQEATARAVDLCTAARDERDRLRTALTVETTLTARIRRALGIEAGVSVIQHAEQVTALVRDLAALPLDTQVSYPLQQRARALVRPGIEPLGTTPGGYTAPEQAPPSPWRAVTADEPAVGTTVLALLQRDTEPLILRRGLDEWTATWGPTWALAAADLWMPLPRRPA